MKINKEQLVKIAVSGSVDHPRVSGYYVGYDGKGRIPIGTGGIVYSHQIGDDCMNIAGDHIEPGISLAHPSAKENHALQTFACVGNEARILNGPMRGEKGMITGTHGGVDHTMVYFPPDVLEEMDGNETILVKAYGQGLKLLDHPDVYIMNLDPDLMEVMEIEEKEDGLHWPVVTTIPAYLMGAGLGSSTLMEGDYDIMTQDEEANQQFHIDKLRFGDIIAIEDHDCQYGPHYKKGAMSIGVVVHSDSFTSGHGPGVTILATSKDGKIIPKKDPEANLAEYKNRIRRK